MAGFGGMGVVHGEWGNHGLVMRYLCRAVEGHTRSRVGVGSFARTGRSRCALKSNQAAAERGAGTVCTSSRHDAMALLAGVGHNTRRMSYRIAFLFI